MKSILSASLCTAALAFSLPAMAQTDAGGTGTGASKPMMHHHRHHSSRMDHMQGPKTHSKRAGDPSTDELNAKSLAAARGGNMPANGDSSGAGSTAPSNTAPSSTAPGTGMAAPSAMPPAGSAPSSGSTGTTTPSNAPGGQ